MNRKEYMRTHRSERDASCYDSNHKPKHRSNVVKLKCQTVSNPPIDGARIDDGGGRVTIFQYV